jgi:hypothetical protein
MSQIKELMAFCRQAISQHPELAPQISDLYELALCEVQEGGSEQHETELAMRDINELLANHARPSQR